MGVVLVVATAAVYAPVRGFDYIAVDDPIYITENPHVLAGLTPAGGAWAFTTRHAANWHPLTWLSHMADVQFFGVNPGAHHVVSVVLHLSSVGILFGLLVYLTATPWRSGFVAVVFALHPLHVESVAWVAERKDVLSGLFFMLTLWAYAHYAARPAPSRMLAVTGLFALGLMAKPMLVTLPVVLLLLDLWPLQRWQVSRWGSIASLVVEKWPLIALSLASSVITILAQQQAGAVASLDGLGLGERLATATIGAADYLAKLVWPANLSFLYPLTKTIPISTLAWSLLLLTVVTILAIRVARSRPAVLVGWFWYLTMLVPVSGILQVGTQASADRYTYLPLIGITVALAWCPPDTWARGRVARFVGPAAVVAVGMAMAILTTRQLPVWRDNVTLWTNAMQVTLGYDKYGAHMALGATMLNQGRYNEAERHYVEASELRPNAAEARYGLGVSFLRGRQAIRAVDALAEAVRLAPSDLAARTDLAAALALAGRTDEAIKEYERLTAMLPGEVKFRSALQALLARKPGAPHVR